VSVRKEGQSCENESEPPSRITRRSDFVTPNRICKSHACVCECVLVCVWCASACRCVCVCEFVQVCVSARKENPSCKNESEPPVRVRARTGEQFR